MFTVEPKYSRVIAVAEASCTRRDFREHALRVCWRARDHPQDFRGCGPLLSFLSELFGQLLDPAFRRSKIIGGRSCHDYTRFPATCPCGFGRSPWRRLADGLLGML